MPYTIFKMINAELTEKAAQSLKIPAQRIAAWARGGQIRLRAIDRGWHMTIDSSRVSQEITNAAIATGWRGEPLATTNV